MTVSRYYEKDDTVYRIYESLDDLIGEADIRSPLREQYKGVFDTDFIGRNLYTWDAARDAAYKVWPEGDEIINGMLEELADVDLPKPVSRKRRQRWSEESGDEIDFDRLRSGQPFWRESRRRHAHGSKFITICVDNATSCGVRADKILWRGAAAVVLTKLLEEAGYRVELWQVKHGSEVFHRGPKNLFHACRLKAASDPLDLPTLTVALSGWFYRTTCFRSYIIDERRTDKSLGYPEPTTGEHLDEITNDEKRQLIENVWDRKAAVALVRKTIEAINAGELELLAS